MKGIIFIVLFTLCICDSSWVSARRPVLFIIDGKPVERGKYPFLVSIESEGSNICGGSIINETTVLTAAHCFDKGYQSLQIVAGVTELTSSDSRQERTISKLIIHPKYRHNPLHDIALIIVDEPFQFDSFVKAVQLEDENIPDEREGIVAGWGFTKEGDKNSSSTYLQEAQVTILSHSDCATEYGEDANRGLLCSLPCCSHEDACQGDSGGPLIHKNKLAGVISAGKGCGSTTEPSVYSYIFCFIDWINNNIVKECDLGIEYS